MATSRVLVIDNHDSFTYNLVQALGCLGAEVEVRLNDAVTVAEALAVNPTHLVISPGPGRPEHAGVSEAVIAAFAGRVPVLGVCLGHQALARLYGASIVHAAELVHGKARSVYHRGNGLYAGLCNPFRAGRYHSLVVDRQGLPSDLLVTARSDDGLIMGLKHRRHQLHGVQFHPESILTPEGSVMLANFLRFHERSKTGRQR